MRQGLKILVGFLGFAQILSIQSQAIFPIRQNGQWGFMDTAGNTVVEPTFEHAMPWENGFAKARNGTTLYLVFSANKIVSIENCNAFEPLQFPFFKARKNGKWWVTDSVGNNLSTVGFDRIWRIQGNDSLYYYILQNKTGVIHFDGRLILNSNYNNLKFLLPGYYSVMQPNRFYILINSKGEKVVADSFTHISAIKGSKDIFYGILASGEKMLFTGKGQIGFKSANLKYQYYKNEFVWINNMGSENYIWDVLLNTTSKIGKATLENAQISDAVYINLKNKTSIFQRGKGIIKKGSALVINTSRYPYVFKDSGYFGILDSNYNEILPPSFLGINIIPNNRAMILFKNGLYALYNYADRKFESDGLYNASYSGKDFCKAYTPSGGMDMYLFDSNNSITDKINYKKVLSKNVIDRDPDGENWWKDFPETKNNSPFIVNVRQRANGWFSGRGINTFTNNSTILWGLVVRGKDTVIKPSFSYVDVQPTAPYSIAGFLSNFKSRGIKMQGTLFYKPSCGFTIINDSTGARLPTYMQFIDKADLNDITQPYLRVYSNGKMMLLNKSNMTVAIACTYASSGETGGVHRLYVGGIFNALKINYTVPNTVDAAFTSDIGLIQTFLGLYNTFTTTGGQWLLMKKNGSYVKPTIAGKLQITAMTSFDTFGKSIVTLSNGKNGVIDTLGNTFIAANYDYITVNTNIPGHFICGMRSAQCGLVNSEGEMLTDPIYHNIEIYGDMFLGKIHDSCFIFQPGKNVNYIGKKTRIANFENGYGFIRTRNGFSLADESGQILDNAKYRGTLGFKNGYAPISHHGKWGLTNSSGIVEMPIKFEAAKPFQLTSGIFKTNSYYNFYSLDGTKIKGPKRANAEFEIAEGLFVYSRGERYAIYNKDGKVISKFGSEKPLLLDSHILIFTAHNIKFLTRQGENNGVLRGLSGLRENQISKQMIRVVRSAEFGRNLVVEFSAGQLRAFGASGPYRNIKMPLGIDRSLKIQKEFWYEAYHNDIYLIGKKGSYRFVNGNGDFLFSQQFYDAQPIQNNRSICKVTRFQVGLLDNYGFWIIQPRYQELKKLNDSTYMYRLAYKYDIINKNGEVINSRPLDFYTYKNGLVQMQSSNAVGYYHPNGRILYEISE